MVKKLIQQRSHTGDIRPRYHRCGRPPVLVAEHQRRLRALLDKKSDMTLAEMRGALGLKCSLQAIHLVLVKMDLSYKKRRSVPANRTARTSGGRAASGGAAKGA
jgi:transposase